MEPGECSRALESCATLDPYQEEKHMSEVVVTSQSNLRNEVRYREGHSFITDEPISAGGEDAGPDPYTLLLAALGSCISMTVTLYARRKQWPLETVSVRLQQNRLHAKDCKECSENQEGYIHRIERSVSVTGQLSDEQRARLLEIAKKCPVHKTLSSPIIIADGEDLEIPVSSEAGNFF
jgi:uncharacterized OsmC-like protein